MLPACLRNQNIHQIKINFFDRSSLLQNNISNKNPFIVLERVLEESYHGLIKENETFVEITPVIRVDEEKVCRLDIVKSQRDIPFKVFKKYIET